MSKLKFRVPFFLLGLLAILGLNGCSFPEKAPSPVAETEAKVVEKVDLGFLRADFAEAFVPTKAGASDKALAQVLDRYNADPRPKFEKVDLFETFAQENPDDPWTPSVKFNIALYYYKAGKFTPALAHLKDAWEGLDKAENPKVKGLADRALAEYALKLAHLGRIEDLGPLLKGAEGRSLSGSATELLASAREGLFKMNETPEVSFLCGPYALRRISQLTGAWTDNSPDILDTLPSTQKGTSLAQVHELSKKLGLDYQIAHRSKGSKVLAPAVVHWRVGHFAALLDQKDGFYPVEDDTAGFHREEITIAPSTLDEEASGYFLVPAGPLPNGWRTVAQDEASTVWGRGNPGPDKDVDATGVGDPTVGGAGGPSASPSAAGGPAGGAAGGSPGGGLTGAGIGIGAGIGAGGGGPGGPGPGGGGGGGGGSFCGMTAWDVHTMLCSLRLTDSPVGWSPAAFSSGPFSVVYAQREVNQPSVFDHSNLGPKWTTNWTSHITLNQIFTIRRATHYLAGGGAERYMFPTGDATVSNKGTYSQASMTYDEGVGFSLDFPGGGREEYYQPIGNSFHLTSVIDPQGNTTTLEYDGSGRLVVIRDPMGRAMTLDYELGTDPLKITKVTDPFGRSASFTYTPDGHLASVTDVVGITSSYQYGANDFINTLTTPYGVTSFTYGDISTDPSLQLDRFIEVVDPAGRRHRTESRPNAAPGTPMILPTSEAQVPVGMPLLNLRLQFRNTFHWEPQQLDSTPDITKATIYHFPHFGSGGMGRVLISMKKPLESRIWYAYDNDGDYLPSFFREIDSHVTHVGRVLSDGSTQLTQYEYNALGNVTKTTDPTGRVFDYTYAANGIDLTSVTRAGQTLMSATYDSSHNVLSLTDSSGQTSTYTYNARGQVLTSTNPLGEVVTNTYTPTGNLAQVEAPLQAITTFNYDFAERVSSATDTEGYTVQATYDSADRPTSVTYPDGTVDTLEYSNLDLVRTVDRIGRETQTTYDTLRRPTSVIDGNGGITGLSYGIEDGPITLTDPNGNQTGFQYDLQQRLSTKTYPGGATQNVTYETCSGRVATVTDALGQSKTYTYFLDNQLQKCDYSGSTPDVTYTQDTFLPRPLTMTDGQGVTTFTYGPVGSPGGNRLSSISGPYGDQASFTYDIAGRPASSIVNGSAESVVYDELWRATSATNVLDTFTMNYLGKTGQVTQVSSSQGPTKQFTYTPNATDRRLAQIKNLAQNGDAISQFDYSYDAIGQITQMVRTHGGGGGNMNMTLHATKDSILRAKKPHRNEGANPTLMLSRRLNEVDKHNNPIVCFNLANTDLNGLTSAKLVFNIKEIPKKWGNNGRDITIQPVTQPWLEGNGKRLKVPQGERTRGTGQGVTWFNPIDDDISNKLPDGAIEWAGARSALGPVTAPPVTIVNDQTGVIEFDVTADVVGGFQDGWIVRKQNESKRGNVGFYSKEGAAEAGNPDLGPRLILEFGGQAPIANNNSGQNVSGSTGGGNKGSLAAQVNEVLSEVWGFQVEAVEEEVAVALAPLANSTDTLDFRYDNLSQLIGVDINQTAHASYQFDPAGNMTSLTVDGVTTNLTYNSRNQIQTPGTNVFDAKGQTTDQDGRTFEWDEQGRVVAIVQGTHRSEFEYDGMSRRTAIVEIENGTTQSRKLYWWLGGTIVCERDGLQPGFPITKRYFGQGVVDNGTKLYYTLDHLGSVQELTDETGVVVADYHYTIYGERTKSSGPQDSDFGFAGLFHHGPSGLDLATYRLYDARQRRFISRDPLGEAVDYNLYRYANNNPVNFIDPSGLKPPSGFTPGQWALVRSALAVVKKYDPEGGAFFASGQVTGQNMGLNKGQAHTEFSIALKVSGAPQPVVLNTAWITHPEWNRQQKLSFLVATLANELYHIRGNFSDSGSDKFEDALLRNWRKKRSKELDRALEEYWECGTEGQPPEYIFYDLELLDYAKAVESTGFPYLPEPVFSR